jgi:predicted phosphodiesterase
MICITGDTHSDFRRFNSKNMTKEISYLIIAGDFGGIWSTNPEDKNENYWLDWLNDKPWETIVCLGNHENYERIYQLPLEQHLGNPMYKVRDKIWIAQHGNVYNIEDMKIFFFGGAESIDKEGRLNRISWWQEEIPSYADYQRGIESLKAVKGEVALVISHTAPTEAVASFGFPEKETDPTIKMLNAMEELLEDDISFFFGHFHENKVIEGKRRKYICLYEDIIYLEELNG